MKDIMDYIDALKKSNKLIIVEGKRDKGALEKLGLKNIVTLSKKPIYKIIEEVAEKQKEAVILTDLDREGKKLYGKLNSGLGYHGVKVDNRFREFLFKETKLRQIEGLKNYIDKQQTF